jgi:hypothetical protein
MFIDNRENFDGSKLRGTWYYRITAVDRLGNESAAGHAVAVDYGR